jgi:Pla-1/cef family extracellular lipase
MNKLAISIAITSVLGLSACDDKSLEDVQQESVEAQQEIKELSTRLRVVWDPANGNVSAPTDLLFSGTSDFTLEMPGEVAAKAAGDAVDFTDPSNILGALDGWGTQNPFVVSIEADDESVAIDATTIDGTSVVLYEVISYPDFRDTECSDTSKATLLCKGVSQLTYGVDYIASTSGNSIVILPVKPLTAQTSYALTLTKGIKDTNGNSLMPSSTYGSVEQDITTTPLVLPSLTDSELNETQAGIRTLQTLINNFETVLANDLSADKDEIVYTQVFTTQSAGVAGTDPLQVTKLLSAKEFATNPLGTILEFEGYNVAQAFAGAGQTLTATATALYSSADVYGGAIVVPYYLETPETGDPLTGRWEAACDSGIVLGAATDAQKAAGTVGDYNETCVALGLADLGLDTQRHLTKYNPLPKTKSTETIDLQATLPNVAAANSFRDLISGGTYPDIAKPDAGWPVVIIQHGITSKKEDMLATTGWLSVMGYATVAIDHPLHGERGFTVVDGDTTTVINTSSSVEGGAATTYLNLSSLLTARDNLRQSAADILQLRLAINALFDVTSGEVSVDPTNVYFMGHSLGGLTGVNAVAIANTPVTADTVADSTIEDEVVRDATAEATATKLNNLYSIKAAVFANPGSSVANFLVESGSFGPLVKASVIFGLGNELTDLATAKLPDCGFTATAAPTSAELICAYTALEDEGIYTTAINSAVSQFAFAAQAALEAGDPSNYTQLLKLYDTPVLVYEVAGDGTDANLPDQTIPNSISTDPFKGIAGTTGLANQLGLSSIIGSIDGTEATSGIVRFTSGSHSTFADPSDDADTDATVHTEMQTIMYQFFNSDGKTYSPTAGKCVVQNVLDESCTE